MVEEAYVGFGDGDDETEDGVELVEVDAVSVRMECLRLVLTTLPSIEKADLSSGNIKGWATVVTKTAKQFADFVIEDVVPDNRAY